MHILVPQKIIREYREGNRNGEFQGIGLFVDISGFSKMTNDLMQQGQHGAEILAIMMRETFAPLVNSVYAHHGFIANFAGDAFTAIFTQEEGIDLASRHALAAAWEIQAIIAEKSFTINGTQVAISVRVGLACGGTSWGIVTSDRGNRAAFYFRGDAVEKCAEAESLAEQGETIIDATIFDTLQPNIRCEQISDHYRVLDVIDAIQGSDLPPLEAPDLDVTSLFYPRELITQRQPGEFRQIVNMFISLPTVRTEEQLSIFMQYFFDLQDQYGGLLNRIDFGDKGSHMLLFWGTPVAYENDIGRALNFILSLQTETSIPIKAGITYRIAHAGFIGAPLREDYTCYGQGVNLAARFMSAAPRGEVWIDEAIAKRVSRFFDVEMIDELSLKGFEEKQKVFSVYERKETPIPFYTGPYIGRQSEKETLAEFVAPLWRPAYAGAMMIVGEAGIGKSRLLHEFLQNSTVMKEHPALIALCQTDQVLRGSFNPFRYWLKRYFGVSETQVESRNKRSFNQTLDNLIEQVQDHALRAELDRTRSFLAALVNLFWSDSLYEQLDPKGRYENTITALITLLKAESLRQPVIIHLEDIQWLDEESKMVFSQLNRVITSDQSAAFPIAVIATSRQADLESPLGADVPIEYLHLDPLSSNEIIELTEALLEAPVEKELLEYFSSLSEGNPFYAEQILYYLKEEDLLDQQQNRWKLKPTRITATPTDVRALLLSRIDQFPSDVKEIMLTASVLGREFDKSVLLQMVGNDQSVAQKIKLLENALIWTEISLGKHLFRSNLLRETAYRMQVHTRRQRLHAVATNALEEVYAEDLKPHYYELAHHAEEGKLGQKACHYLTLAGETASENYQNNQAVDYFSRALLHTEPDDPETQIKLLLKREYVYNIMGKRQEQQADLDQAEMLAEQGQYLHQLADIAVKKISLSSTTNEFEKVIADSPAVMDFLEQSQRPDLIISLNIAWAHVLRVLGEYDQARQRLLLNRTLAQEIGDLRGEGSTLVNLGLVEMDQANFTQARAYHEDSLRIAQQLNIPFLLAQSLNNLGVAASEQGDYSSAADYYQRSLEIAQRIGTRQGEAVLNTNLGWLAGIMGDYPASIEYLEKSYRIQREIRHGYGEATALFNLSLFTGAQGNFPLAKSYAEESIALVREIQYRSGEAIGLTFLGHALTGLGDLPEAKAAYQDALELNECMELSNLCCEPIAGLAQIGLLESDLVAAEQSAKEILAHLEKGGTLERIDHPNFVRVVCYKVLAALADPGAGAFLEEMHASLQDQAERIQDEALRRSFLNNVPWHQEILQYYQNYQNDLKG